MKSFYIKNGNNWSVTDSQNIDLHDHLPPDTYVVLFHPEKGYYLSQVEPMSVPKKIYGTTNAHVDRIFNTFNTRTRNTGVLLNGEKGSGKTLTLSLLAHKFIEAGFPVILINSVCAGESFNKFISEISQPCMVAFDEFDKVYDNDEQSQILTLLDGVFNSSKLFVITCNDSWKINPFMLNRPGRIFYNFKYRGMEEDAIRSYCDDNLHNNEHIDGLLAVAGTIDSFNFDMLKALVEEMNRYKETAKQAISILNIRPERSTGVNYKYAVSRGGGNIFFTGELNQSINPFNGHEFAVYIEEPNPKYNPNGDGEEISSVWPTIDKNIVISFKDVKSMGREGYVYEKEGYHIHIVKESEPTSYPDYL